MQKLGFFDSLSRYMQSGFVTGLLEISLDFELMEFLRKLR